MVTIILHCPHCQSEALVRDGHAPNGKQLYRCRACGRRSRENPTPNTFPQARREEILHAYQERSSLRGLTRTFGISRTTQTSPLQAGRGIIGKADGQTLEAFYQTNHDLIYRYVYRSVGNREEAEDLTSQIFLKVVSSLDDTRGAKVAKFWLFQLTRTTIADYWRTRARAPTYSLEALLDTGWEGPTEEPRSSTDTAANRVQLLLQALPAPYREVLTCRFLLNLSIRDTARRMGLTVSNVKVLQFRALKRAADLAPTVLG
jgi:RNA polymerase sigma-70 factor (ECF subfamily)